jgi:hypothetical protein
VLDVDELAQEVRKIRSKVEEDKVLAASLGRNFRKVTDGEYINHRRILVQVAMRDLVKAQPNHFLVQLMRRVFQENTKE